MFKPDQKYFDNHRIPMLMNANLEVFPVSTLLEAFQLAGGTIKATVRDDMGIITVAGKMIADQQHMNPIESNQMLVLVSKRSSASAIYVAVEDDHVDAVGQAIDMVLRDSSVVSVDSTISHTDVKGTVHTTISRNLNVRTADLNAFFVYLPDLKEGLWALQQIRSA